ncbi:MAG: hypothetical protein WB783_03695 [Arenicellales bacterium]
MGDVTPIPAQTLQVPGRTARDSSASPNISSVPSIAVAPFTNLGDDGGLDKLAARLVEEIGRPLLEVEFPSHIMLLLLPRYSGRLTRRGPSSRHS